MSKEIIEHSIKILVKKIQDEYDRSVYSETDQHDRIYCSFCGGHYTRREKSKHTRTKKHQKKITRIVNEFNDSFIIHI